MSRYTKNTYTFVLDDTDNNVADLPYASVLQFGIEYEYAPATPHDRVTPGEAAEVNILQVTLQFIRQFDGCGERAFRKPTVQEQARAELFLNSQISIGGYAAHQLTREILREEEGVY